jgi:hypothetical protein
MGSSADTISMGSAAETGFRRLMEPITGIIAAVSAANSAFTVIKKLVATGKEIEEVAGQIGKWYGGTGGQQ